MNLEDIYNNRASLGKTDNHRDATDSECCEEELVFALQDKYHRFSVGLSTILNCLYIADQESYVPPLPDAWWAQIRRER